MSNFQPLEVVDRGSEAQLQVGKNVITYLSRLWLRSLVLGFLKQDNRKDK